MSGGGFRASLFHLGVLKRLHELEILEKATHISAVSGGAVTAALYVDLKCRKGAGFTFQQLEESLLKGVKKNPRTRWLVVTLAMRLTLRLLPLYVWVFLEKSLRDRFSFDRFFRDEFFGTRKLTDLAGNGCAVPIPRLILNTTSLELGQDFFFTPDYIGPRELAALGLQQSNSRANPATVPISRAVGASACFPIAFTPYSVDIAPDKSDDMTDITDITLSRTQVIDGGVFDNQGFRIFLDEPRNQFIPNPIPYSRRVDYVIASDASKTLNPSAQPLPTSFFRRMFLRLELLLRAHSITEDRARWERFALLLYARNAKDVDQTAFLHTDSSWREQKPYRLPVRLQRGLARLRTDFDSFTDLEIIGLMYLGYTLINLRIFGYCRELLPASTQNHLDQAGVPYGDVPWQPLLQKLKRSPDGVPPLKTWKDFAADVKARIPVRTGLSSLIAPWIERPWRNYLNEVDPENTSDQYSAAMAIRHVERGATTSFVWRGLQRMIDRGGVAGGLGRLLRALLVLSITYLLVTIVLLLVGRLHEWERFLRHYASLAFG